MGKEEAVSGEKEGKCVGLESVLLFRCCEVGGVSWGLE